MGGIVDSIFGGGDDINYPQPDANIGRAALKNAEIAQEALNFYKQAYEDSKPRQAQTDALAKQLVDEQLATSKQNRTQAEEQWQRFQDTYIPVEDKVVQDAMTIDSEGEQSRAAGEAAAGVQAQYDSGIAQGRRRMASMGINPNSGRSAALEQEGALGLAAAKAGASTDARLKARDRGITLRAGVANFGRNMPNTAANYYGLSTTSGNSAMSNNIAAQNAANANTGIMGQGYSTAMQGNTSAANILNQQYNSQLNAWNMQQQADSASSAGFGNLVGQLGSAALLAPVGTFSSKKFKTDKRKIDPNTVIKGLRRTPVEKWRYLDGVSDGGEHIGPYAEDMRREFGDAVAPGGKMIDMISVVGLNMAATKALDSKIEKLDKRIAVVSKGLKRGKKEARR